MRGDFSVRRFIPPLFVTLNLKTMRNLQLTDDEVELVKNALLYTHDRKLGLIPTNARLLDKTMTDPIIASANRYMDLANEITNGDKDV